MNEAQIAVGLKTFQEISSFLLRNAARPFSFEIIPSATPRNEQEEQQPDIHLLVDNDAAAIRKRDLLPAFLTARLRLLSQASSVNGSGQVDAVVWKQCLSPHQLALNSVDPFLAAWVVSLYDPEHLTAANHRKRLLKRQSGVEWQNKSGLDYLSLELNLTRSILTSPLHKHSKSPTLWFQRLWIMKQFKPWEYTVLVEDVASGRSKSLSVNEDGSSSSLTTANVKTFWLSELDVVLSAAEQHERNYPAFQYLRELFVAISSLEKSDLSSLAAVAEMLHEASTRVSQWSLQHPRDISALTCLAWLLRQAQQHGAEPKKIQAVVDGVKAFQSRLQWQGDGVRVFLLLIEGLA